MLAIDCRIAAFGRCHNQSSVFDIRTELWCGVPLVGRFGRIHPLTQVGGPMIVESNRRI